MRRRTAIAACLGALTTFAMVPTGSGANQPAAAPTVPRLKRVVVIVFENRSYAQIMGNSDAPTFNALAKRHAVLTAYHALARPSLPNYLAMVSGSTHGVRTNCDDCTIDSANLADTIETSGSTWKTYAEGLPERGYTGAESGRYVKRHNPLLYFKSVTERPERLQRIVPLTEFAGDLEGRRLPRFSLVVPDLCNGMHDCSIAHGDAWLRDFVGPLLASPQLAGGAVFVTFDEGRRGDPSSVGGRVPMLVLGPMVRPGSRLDRRRTHYSLLRTIEDAWGLAHLGKAATARPITGIWRYAS